LATARDPSRAVLLCALRMLAAQEFAAKGASETNY
jgi:hypothetical protein